MDLQSRKNEFIQKILNLQNEELMFELENTLKKATTKQNLELKPLSIEELNARIDQSELDFKNGKFKSSEELLSKYSL
jgi:uncharacterized protein YjcR